MLNIDIDDFEIHTTNMKINDKNQDIICISFDSKEVPASVNKYYDVNQVDFNKSSLTINFTDGNSKENDIIVKLKPNSLDEETYNLLNKYEQIVIYGAKGKNNHINDGFSFLSSLNNTEPQMKSKKKIKPF